MIQYTELNFQEKKFKKFGGEYINDITKYVNDYVKTGEDIKIIVGCDSHNRRHYTMYAIVIVLYDFALRNGAHVIYLRYKDKKERDIYTRLFKEGMLSLDTANYLEENLDPEYQPKFGLNI